MRHCVRLSLREVDCSPRPERGGAAPCGVDFVGDFRGRGAGSCEKVFGRDFGGKLPVVILRL
jgi:hypothetical protein